MLFLGTIIESKKRLIHILETSLATRDALLEIANKSLDHRVDLFNKLATTSLNTNNDLRRTNTILGSERDTLQSANTTLLAQLNITQAELDELYNSLRTPEPAHYIVSHHPRPGYPWIVERWWSAEQIWVPLKLYHNSITAFDVRDRLNSGELKPLDLFN